MASHHLAIAKASLSAALLRPDPVSVSRDEITTFHTTFDRTLSHCSPANIQTCKLWLLKYVTTSSNRVGVWAKYLVALSSSFGDEGKPEPRTTPSVRKKRLHILYQLNDVFHHTKYHLDSTTPFFTLSSSLQPFIVELLSYTASYDRSKYPKHHKRLDTLLDVWEEQGYYGSDYVNKLREVVKNSALSGPVKTSIDIETNSAVANKLPGKDVPFMMPSTHGDMSTPFYDLPAGNMVPHIIPNSTVPLRPDSIKPLQFLAGPADNKLVTALKTFLKDVDQIYGAGKPEIQEDKVIDIDELGQTVVRDADTGEILDGDTYYGWSRSFCEQMKNRNIKPNSRSRSRSRSPRKRRYSHSIDSDDSRWSRSRSRSQTPRKRGLGRFDSNSRSRSRSASWRSRSKEKSYSPRGPSPPRSFPPAHHPQKPPTNQYGTSNASRPTYPPPMHFPPTGSQISPPPFPPGRPGLPPPPPSGYQGAWPPPPPPMPHYGTTGPNQSGLPPPPPFPPGQFPPVHMSPGQQLPPGSFHFPPPHSGGRGGWGQSQGYPPGRWK